MWDFQDFCPLVNEMTKGKNGHFGRKKERIKHEQSKKI